MLRSRRNLMLGTVLASASLAIDGALAQQPAAQQPPAQPAEAGRPDKLLEDLVAANKILADQGVLDGYGHVSVRSPTNPERFWMARSVAPELVTAADLYEHDLAGNAKDDKLFSRMLIKVLTPEQLFDSLVVATGNPGNRSLGKPVRRTKVAHPEERVPGCR